MKIILLDNVESFTGSLDKSYGYAVRKQKGGFYLCKNSLNAATPRYDGHLRVIAYIVSMARQKFVVADVRCSPLELKNAIHEAGYLYGYKLAELPHNHFLNASEVREIIKAYVPWIVS